MGYEVLRTRVVYDNRWLRVREDVFRRPDGVEGLYGVVEKPPFAVVIAWDGERVALVEQYRYPIGRRFWEFPQGALDGQSEQAPEMIARTELQEETGMTADRMTALGMLYLAPGLSNQPMHAFLAEGLAMGEHQREHEEHDLRVEWFTLDEVHGLMRTGDFADNASVAALYLWRGMFHVEH